MRAPGGRQSGPALEPGITLPPLSKTDLTNPLLRRFKLHVNSFLNIGVRHSILRFAGEQLTNLRKDQSREATRQPSGFRKRIRWRC